MGGGVLIFTTDSGYFPWANDGLVKILRRKSDGQFTLLIKGGGLAPTAGYDGWHLMVASAGSNPIVDNTYTTSNYYVIDNDVLDRHILPITRIGIEQK